MPSNLSQAQINAVDAAFPKLSRLLIAQAGGPHEVVAINLDTKEQIGVCTFEAYNFFPDCIGEDEAAQYSQGLPTQTLMSADNWELWAESCNFENEPDFVWLTCCKEKTDKSWLSAVSIAGLKEAMIPIEERSHFIKDLIGFNPEKFELGYGVPCRISTANWADWLETFGSSSMSAEELEHAFDFVIA